MSQGSAEILATVWTDPPRMPLIEAVLGRMSQVRLAAVGGPRKANLTEFAESHGARVEDDFRRLVREQPARFLLLATGEGVTRADLQHVRSTGATVIAIEPPLPDLAPEPAAAATPETLIAAPSLRLSKAWLAAADPQQALGAVRAMHLTALAPPEAGSLYARLYDAMDTLVHFRGVPDAIDAALTGPLSQPPDDLRGLTGHLTAHLRFGSDASATVIVSDRAAGWTRRLTVLGAEGQLILEDDSYRLLTREGQEVDSLQPKLPWSPDAAALIALQWQHHLDNPAAPIVSNTPAVIACCQAALLSCRTSDHESPQKLLEMRG